MYTYISSCLFIGSRPRDDRFSRDAYGKKKKNHGCLNPLKFWSYFLRFLFLRVFLFSLSFFFFRRRFTFSCSRFCLSFCLPTTLHSSNLLFFFSPSVSSRHDAKRTRRVSVFHELLTVGICDRFFFLSTSQNMVKPRTLFKPRRYRE